MSPALLFIYLATQKPRTTLHRNIVLGFLYPKKLQFLVHKNTPQEAHSHEAVIVASDRARRENVPRDTFIVL